MDLLVVYILFRIPSHISCCLHLICILYYTTLSKALDGSDEPGRKRHPKGGYIPGMFSGVQSAIMTCYCQEIYVMTYTNTEYNVFIGIG